MPLDAMDFYIINGMREFLEIPQNQFVWIEDHYNQDMREQVDNNNFSADILSAWYNQWRNEEAAPLEKAYYSFVALSDSQEQLHSYITYAEYNSVQPEHDVWVRRLNSYRRHLNKNFVNMQTDFKGIPLDEILDYAVSKEISRHTERVTIQNFRDQILERIDVEDDVKPKAPPIKKSKDDKVAKKALKKSINVLSSFTSPKLVAEFVGDKEIVVSGKNYKFAIQKNPSASLVQLSSNKGFIHNPIKIVVTDLNDIVLCELCSYLSGVPVLDQVLDIYMHFKVGIEDEILSNGNIFGRTDAYFGSYVETFKHSDGPKIAEGFEFLEHYDPANSLPTNLDLRRSIISGEKFTNYFDVPKKLFDFMFSDDNRIDTLYSENASPRLKNNFLELRGIKLLT